MAKINATDISSASTSWYQRLRGIQGKNYTGFKSGVTISQTVDPNIGSGTKATAAQFNTFVNALNGLQSNIHLAYANWSAYKPSTTSVGSKITKSTIDSMLTSLESVNSNYPTDTVYSDNYHCSRNGTTVSYSNYPYGTDVQSNYSECNDVNTPGYSEYENITDDYSTWADEGCAQDYYDTDDGFDAGNTTNYDNVQDHGTVGDYSEYTDDETCAVYSEDTEGASGYSQQTVNTRSCTNIPCSDTYTGNGKATTYSTYNVI